MNEVKIVQFPLKTIIEEVFVALVTEDSETLEEQKYRLNKFLSKITPRTKLDVIDYINRHKLVLENRCLREYFKKLYLY